MFKHHSTALIAGLVGALALAPAAFAGQTPRADLNPPPPDLYTCTGTADQTICRASIVDREDPVITDVDCPGFPIVDQGDVSSQLVRRYDADGNWVKRVVRERWTNAFWSNPLNGNTITETLVGENIYTDPVTHKKVMASAGRTVFAPDGTLEFSAGQQPFIERFVFGDPSAFDALCAALAR